MIIHNLKIGNRKISIENILYLHYYNMKYRVSLSYKINFYDYVYRKKDFKTLQGTFKYIRKNLYVRN